MGIVVVGAGVVVVVVVVVVEVVVEEVVVGAGIKHTNGFAPKQSAEDQTALLDEAEMQFSADAFEGCPGAQSE